MNTYIQDIRLRQYEDTVTCDLCVVFQVGPLAVSAGETTRGPLGGLLMLPWQRCITTTRGFSAGLKLMKGSTSTETHRLVEGR